MIDIGESVLMSYLGRPAFHGGTLDLLGASADPANEVVMMRAGLAVMPKEGRLMVCPPAPPAAIADVFGPMFHAFHNQEAYIPTGMDVEVLGGPVFKMTGFVGGGPDDVILSKPYFQTLDVTTENTLIELRHTPE